MVLPNQLTVLRIILTPVFLVLFLSGNPLLIQISSVVFIIAAITDWYDGWLARKFNYITDWGKFMDPLADKVLTLTAFMGFVLIDVLSFWMVLLIILRDLIITLLRLYADYKKINFTTSKSAKWKTFLQMAFLYYLLLVYTLKTFEYLNQNYKSLFESLLNPTAIYLVMLAITLFTIITGITYFVSNWSIIKRLFRNEN
jgi:CDP-diacylglycerol---glycerol-3-phosphate 3-phosphatidyltransferase